MTPACVKIAGAGKQYASPRGPVTALDDVSMTVAEGEFLSLLGPSGCGKSTLLKCIAGLERLTKGSLQIRGEIISAPADGLGMVFQRDALLDWRNILDNVLITAELQGRDRRPYVEPARALLTRFGLGAFTDRHPWELSGGMRQRAAICRALLCEPTILLMDEPFGALDAMTRDDLNLELTRFWQQARRTVIFVTHSIAEAVFLSDRIAIMTRGPGRVEEIVDVDLPRPRSLAVRETQAFAALAAQIHHCFARLGVMKE